MLAGAQFDVEYAGSVVAGGEVLEDEVPKIEPSLITVEVIEDRRV
jgi:hypothetical protein